VEVESTTILDTGHEETEGLVQKIDLFEGELAETRRAHEVVEETTRGLSDAATNVERRWEESEREHWEQFEVLTLL
jgi:hypothetical protein